jgi:hypothetical protein
MTLPALPANRRTPRHGWRPRRSRPMIGRSIGSVPMPGSRRPHRQAGRGVPLVVKSARAGSNIVLCGGVEYEDGQQPVAP